MLRNYFQNSEVGMTKDQYFEMMEMLGKPVIDSDIPIEHDDFPVEIQQAFIVYRMLKDEWDTFSGTYFGKSLIGVTEILNAVEIDDPVDQRLIISLVRSIDSIRIELLESKKKPGSK